MADREKINSDEYWNFRFKEDWESFEGPRQSRFFSRIAIDHLPGWFMSKLEQESLSLIDWGCAQGDGTDVWASYIDAGNICGVDFSSVAIQQASERYPAIRFANEDWLAGADENGKMADVVFSSNTLEHFHQPYNVLRALITHARKAVVLALPYRELDRIEEHFYSFMPTNIPARLDNGFRLVWSQVVDCRTLPNTLWGGDQIILIYADPQWVDELGLKLQDCRIEISDTVNEIKSLKSTIVSQNEELERLRRSATGNPAFGEMIAESNKLLSHLNKVLTERDEKIIALAESIAEQQKSLGGIRNFLSDEREQQATFAVAIAERETKFVTLTNALEARDSEIGSLRQAVSERDAWLNQLAQRVKAIESSHSWRITAPLRKAMSLARGNGDFSADTTPKASPSAESIWLRRLNYIGARYRQGVQRHGLVRSLPLAARALNTLGSAWLSKTIHRRSYQQKLRALRKIITERYDFIDLFHVPMGWSTPLFQRFQHMSLQAAQCGGLALYGGHLQVDKDLFVFEQAQGNVVVFDALDAQVVQCVFDALLEVKHPKILRLQSIDLATRIHDVERFLEQGITVVYEYIDEISEEITGSIPEFVIERHKWLLQNSKIFVVATSDKLFGEVSKYRDSRSILSTNGVDLRHWRTPVERPPIDMEPALKSGRIIVGYHGALANWVDYDLLREIAEDGSYELVLIGYEHDASFAESGLANHPNVHFLGSKSYFVLNEYAAFYNIGILPFKRYALTESVSPVKLFEYMASGKPVVTTALSECLKYESCFVSETNEMFMKNLVAASASMQNEDYTALLKRNAEQNSWLGKAMLVYQLAGVDIKQKPLPELEVKSQLSR